MRTVIIHGKRISPQSPRLGRSECELWGVTRANSQPAPHFWGGGLRDWTRWFDLHPLTKTTDFDGIPLRRPDAWRWYRAQDGGRPIYLQDPDHATDPVEAARLFRQIDGAAAFPIDRLRARFALADEPGYWFLCQVGMMMAFALLEGFEHLILNGIGTISSREHQHLHRDIGYWIGFARGLGVRVTIEGPSTFRAAPKIYAYETLAFTELAAMRREFAGPSLAELDSRREINAREQARGRPVRFRVPAPE